MSDFDDNIKECPHCFGRVMIMSDGKCPTCWGDANIPNATGRRRYTIRAGSKLPAACVVCGEPTKR